jgi:hypothetical protein
MARNYSATPSKLKAAKLNQKILASIGSLIRAFAEIEDLITLFISNLAGISESKAVVLLGRTNISRKLEIALYLAKMTNQRVTTLHKKLFGSDFSEVLECRNAVAHGVLLGKWNDDDKDTLYAFLTSKTEEPTGSSASQVVISFTAERLAEVAQVAEKSIPIVERLLQLEPLRQRRLGQSLGPHRKAQPDRSHAKSIITRLNHRRGN